MWRRITHPVLALNSGGASLRTTVILVPPPFPLGFQFWKDRLQIKQGILPARHLEWEGDGPHTPAIFG